MDSWKHTTIIHIQYVYNAPLTPQYSTNFTSAITGLSLEELDSLISDSGSTSLNFVLGSSGSNFVFVSVDNLLLWQPLSISDFRWMSTITEGSLFESNLLDK